MSSLFWILSVEWIIHIQSTTFKTSVGTGVLTSESIWKVECHRFLIWHCISLMELFDGHWFQLWVWVTSTAISKIENLEPLLNLRCLYLNQVSKLSLYPVEVHSCWAMMKWIVTVEILQSQTNIQWSCQYLNDLGPIMCWEAWFK
jgi:hypothetical protein